MLLATDAAGEGINLQRAHLMVNYDLPWNPNRLEQRFGRIHRIGQTEVCHLWNLVAEETREGDVYRTLLDKLEEAREALGGQVFDVLGKLQFEGKPLRDLLIEAIRYGDQPEVRARLTQVVEHAFDRGAAAGPARGAARSSTTPWTPAACTRIREDMERAEARRLQPHYIESFFLEAFARLGGTRQAARAAPLRGHPRPGAGAQPRPADRHRRAGPAALRAHRLREGAGRARRASRWRRSSARATRCSMPSIDLTLERHRDLLRRGAVLVDERDPGTEPARALLPRARDPGRQPHPRGRPAGHLQADALRGDRRRRHRAPPRTTRPTSTTARSPTASRTSRRSSRGRSAPGSTASSSSRRSATRSPHVVPEHLARCASRQARAASPRPRPRSRTG